MPVAFITYENQKYPVEFYEQDGYLITRVRVRQGVPSGENRDRIHKAYGQEWETALVRDFTLNASERSRTEPVFMPEHLKVDIGIWEENSLSPQDRQKREEMVAKVAHQRKVEDDARKIDSQTPYYFWQKHGCRKRSGKPFEPGEIDALLKEIIAERKWEVVPGTLDTVQDPSQDINKMQLNVTSVANNQSGVQEIAFD